MDLMLTKAQKRKRTEDKIAKFQELMKEIVKETGISVRPSLIVDERGILPILRFVEVDPTKKTAPENAAEKVLEEKEEIKIITP